MDSSVHIWEVPTPESPFNELLSFKCDDRPDNVRYTPFGQGLTSVGKLQGYQTQQQPTQAGLRHNLYVWALPGGKNRVPTEVSPASAGSSSSIPGTVRFQPSNSLSFVFFAGASIGPAFRRPSITSSGL